MAASPKKSLALDTNLLLDLAGEKDFAHEFKEEFSRRGYTLHVPPTVVAELEFFASQKDSPQHELANVALEKMNGWECQPFTLFVHPTGYRHTVRLALDGVFTHSRNRTERREDSGASITGGNSPVGDFR